MIHKNAIVHWRRNAPFTDDIQVEQDLLLTGMLSKIYAHSELSKKIALRGGTCLQKFFMPKVLRYSEDLDFVQIKKEPIGDTINILRDVLSNVFEKDGLTGGTFVLQIFPISFDQTGRGFSFSAFIVFILFLHVNLNFIV